MVRFAMQNVAAEAAAPASKRQKTYVSDGTVASALAAADDEDRSFAAVFDPDILDCGVCMEPLSAPIFQCPNGHVACTVCYAKMNNVCPSCSTTIGKIRCLAIEKLIDSLHMNCKYAEFGCLKMLKYSKKKIHESECSFAPVPCPLEGCDHSVPLNDVSDHFRNVHRVCNTSILGSGGGCCRFTMDSGGAQHMVRVDDTLFLLVVEQASLGNIVYLCYFGASKQGPHTYTVRVNWGKTHLQIESDAQRVGLGWKKPAEFLVVPLAAYTEGKGRIEVELSIS